AGFRYSSVQSKIASVIRPTRTQSRFCDGTPQHTALFWFLRNWLLVVKNRKLSSRNCRRFCNCQSNEEPQDSTDFHYRLATISISITYNQQISTSFNWQWNLVRD